MFYLGVGLNNILFNIVHVLPVNIYFKMRLISKEISLAGHQYLKYLSHLKHLSFALIVCLIYYNF